MNIIPAYKIFYKKFYIYELKKVKWQIKHNLLRN